MAAADASEDGDDVTENLSRIEEEFQCSLCLNRLNDPKILLCFHSFCAECLESWYHHCLGESIVCPECRTETHCSTGISELKDDFRAKSVINNLPKLTADATTSENKQCTSCDYKNAAICGCLQCSDLLCRECQFAHRRLKITRNHTVLGCKDFNLQSRLLAIKDAAASASKGLLFTFGGRGNNNGELQSPSCVSYHGKYIHVSDLNGVHTFDQDGQFIKATPIERLIVCTMLWKPILWNRRSPLVRLLYLTPEIFDMAFLTNGCMVYTTSYGYLSISSPIIDDEFRNFEIRNIGAKILTRPAGVAVDSHNLIYVSDWSSACIFCFAPGGEFVKKISCKGQGEGQLQNPSYIAISPRDEVIVTDTIYTHRKLKFKRSAKIFDKKGHFLTQFDLGEPITECASDLYRNRQGSSIAVTKLNQILILDPESKVVHLFTDKGQYLRTVTKFEGFRDPKGICLIDDTDTQLLVSVDKGDHCLKVFKF